MCRSYDPIFVKKSLWVFYLAIALVFIQGAQLHVHFYDHDPLTSEHAHHEQAHFNHDSLVIEHPDTVAEIDLSQQGFLKSISFGSLIIAFFVTVIVILSPRLLTRVHWRYEHHVPLVSRSLSLRPPLRAPPL